MKEIKNTPGVDASFISFVVKHMLPVLGVVVVAMAVLWFALQYFESPNRHQDGQYQDAQHSATPQPLENMHASEAAHEAEPAHEPDSTHEPGTASVEDTRQVATGVDMHAAAKFHEPEAAHVAADSQVQAPETDAGTSHAEPSGASVAGHDNGKDTGEQAVAEHGTTPQKKYPAPGMAFVDAVIEPMDKELNQRGFGWRPNDIIEYTDNINQFQLGVLEVTRRTSRILAERISRTGSSARFDPNLENAMNSFMIKADRYMFPSAETKYRDGLMELRAYYENLERGEAQFYTRTDNLIPLLKAYEDLLGSCDENLVKKYEADGSAVSSFMADDYFFYAQGVASALYTILQAIELDFHIMVSREGGTEVLHHAIEMCHQATEIDPWLILNSKYSSLFANHRANMAAPISHARFYVGVLIKALST